MQALIYGDNLLSNVISAVYPTAEDGEKVQRGKGEKEEQELAYSSFPFTHLPISPNLQIGSVRTSMSGVESAKLYV